MATHDETAPDLTGLTVILAAAGSGRRIGGTPKQLLEIVGKPLLAWSVELFAGLPFVRRLILLCPENCEAAYETRFQSYAGNTPMSVVAGGAERALSIERALALLNDDDPWVAVHDGARPLATPALVERTFRKAIEFGAAVPALRPRETIKRVDASGEHVEETPDRASLRAVQTPQIFARQTLLEAYRHARQSGTLEQMTDDASVVEAMGEKVYVVDGDDRNLKVTYALDVRVVTMLLTKDEPCRSE